MPYLDGLPVATSVNGHDIIAVDQGGNPGVPGTATTRQTTVAKILQLSPGPITGPGSSISGNLVAFDGTEGNILKDAGFTVTAPLQPVVSAASVSLGANALLQMLSTGHFFSNDGALVNRINDRLFIGAATENAATLPPTTGSWVGSTPVGYFDIISQLEVVSTLGGIAGAFASRASDNNPANGPLPPDFAAAFGIASFVTNDHLTTPNSVWAAYLEATNIPGAQCISTLAAELDIANQQATIDNSPYSMAGQGTTAPLWLANGGEIAQSGIPVNPASVAIGILSDGPRNAIAKTGALYNKGIVFMADCLVGSDGFTAGSSASAIEMAMGHAVTWRNGAANTNVGGMIRSDNQDKNFQTRLLFGQAQFIIAGTKADLATEVVLMSVVPNQTAVNSLQVGAGSTGAPVTLIAVGTDANIDLELGGQGTGQIRINKNATAATTPSAFTATNFIGIKDATGTVYFIPCRTSGW